MKIRSDRSISHAIAIVLIVLFMGTSVLVVLSGAGAYTRACRTAESNNGLRVRMSYALNLIHMAEPGTAEIREKDGVNMLIVHDADRAHFTALYAYDGYLTTLYTGAENEFGPADGEKLTPMAAFDAVFEADGLLRFTMTDEDGNTAVMHAAVSAERNAQ